MRRRSRVGGESTKAQRRKTAMRKSRIAAKAVRSRNSSAAREERKVARLIRERDEARQRQSTTAIENTRLLNELRESLEQQTATSEVLEVISSSPGDLQPVFAIMLENAVRICDAKFGNIYRWDGDSVHLVATHNTPPAFAEARRRSPLRPDLKTPFGRMIATKTVIHVADTMAERAYIEQRPAFVEAVELGGIRTYLAVPMLKENELIGAFALARQEVRPFTDKQIALVQNFAAQAVIAIENARLLNELRQRTTDLSESLEQQTAISEILRVISSSPTDVQPTFDAIAGSARRLCDAANAMVFRFDGELIHLAAYDNLDAEQLAAVRSVFPLRPGRESITARAILTRAPVHVRDRRNDPELQFGVLSTNFPTTLSVPLLRHGVPLGAITVTRTEVALFSDRQVELLQTFADQAAIAIENVRLFKA